MNTQKPVLSRVLSLAAIPLLIACSEPSDPTVSPATKQPDNAAQIFSQQQSAIQNQSFSTFYLEFSNAVKNSDWTGLAEMSTFPFALRGELDSDPEVILDKQKFINTIGEVFKEEVYISIDDDLIATNYLDIIVNRKHQHVIMDGEAQLFGLYFNYASDTWKFTGISTHVHIVEKYLEET